MWALGYDGARMELWDLLSSYFENYVSIENNHNYHINLFPNPARNSIKISGLTGIHNSINIFDLMGNLVATDAPIGNESSINIEHLNEGVYLLIISTSDEKQRIIKRLVKK